MKWSRHSITPTDYATFIHSGGIDEAKMLGANGHVYCNYFLYFVSTQFYFLHICTYRLSEFLMSFLCFPFQANIYFQTLATRAREWKDTAEKRSCREGAH